MRTIQVSEGTYAALWSKWQENDDGEEGILRRLLGIDGTSQSRKSKSNDIGYRDNRYGVEFPEGFEIFRTYKGREYRAIAEDGAWRRPDINRIATSLNALSAQIGAPTENAWLGWNFKDGDRTRPVADLRDPARIRRRSSS